MQAETQQVFRTEAALEGNNKPKPAISMADKEKRQLTWSQVGICSKCRARCSHATAGIARTKAFLSSSLQITKSLIAGGVAGAV
jgi:hypothetical protein